MTRTRVLTAIMCCAAMAAPVLAAKQKRLDRDSSEPIIVRPAEKTVTLDVKDAEARVILKSMQKQCGVKNLVFDPQVNETFKGTFLFKDVPCRTAFEVVLRSLGLTSVTYSNSLVSVGTGSTR